MNLRTLSKETCIHLINICCILVAWSVTGYYFDVILPVYSEVELGKFLITPVYIADYLLQVFGEQMISGNPLRMFLVLWVSYALPALWFTPVLMVRNHRVADLKDWYNSKSK